MIVASTSSDTLGMPAVRSIVAVSRSVALVRTPRASSSMSG